MTQPISPASLEELRRLMHLDWADGAVDGRPKLADTDRAARLYGIVADPYHHLAFGNLSRCHLMLICIYGLLENQQWDKAFRAIGRLDRMERERERERARHMPLTGHVAPAPQTTMPPPVAAPTPPKPAAPSAPLSRAVMMTMPAGQLAEFCAAQLGISIDDLGKVPGTAAPFT